MGTRASVITRGARRLTTGAIVLAVALSTEPRPVRAQSTLIGSVTSDSAGKHGIDGVQVSIVALKVSVRTNAEGIYIINGLALGKYVVAVRAIGYKNLEDSVTIETPDATERNFVLAAYAQPLDPVVTTATKREYVSPMLRGFEDRRAQGYGHFVSEADLRKVDNERLSDIMLPHFPGIRLVHSARGTFLASTRNSKNGPTVLSTGGGCFATLYLDGVLVYDLQTSKSTPPNLDDYNINQLAGVEFYGGEAAVPMGYRNSGCGVLLLWTRER